VTTEKGIAIEMSYSDARSLVAFLWGFILWYQGTCFLCLTDTKEKEHSGATAPRTNQIVSCFDALSITYF
jgi:hypothetical protein